MTNELPLEYIARGWTLVDAGWGWVKAVHTSGRETPNHYPAKHRGLKFVLRSIDKIEREDGFGAAASSDTID